MVVTMVFTAFIAVGLTSPAEGPLSISIHPVFLRFEPSACGQPIPRFLAFDLDIKLGSFHAHAGWPGFTFMS
jgi:hypothetical protein